jgi:hypothetical protein
MIKNWFDQEKFFPEDFLSPLRFNILEALPVEKRIYWMAIYTFFELKGWKG